MTWRTRFTGFLRNLRDGMLDGSYGPAMSGAGVMLDRDPGDLEAGIAQAADSLRVQIGGDCGASIGATGAARQATYSLFCDTGWLTETRARARLLQSRVDEAFGSIGETGPSEVLRSYRDELETQEEQTGAIAPTKRSWWDNAPREVKGLVLLAAVYFGSELVSKWR